MAQIEITRLDVPASDLRHFARQRRSGREACRLLAIAMLLGGSIAYGGSDGGRHGCADAAGLG